MENWNTIVTKQARLFCRIICREFPSKIHQFDKLRHNDLNRTTLRAKSVPINGVIEKHFPRLNTKNEIEEYCKLYKLGHNPMTVHHLPNGMIEMNRELDDVTWFLLEELEQLYQWCFECKLALELMLPQYRDRNPFEYSFIKKIRDDFAQYESNTYCQYQRLCQTTHQGRVSRFGQIERNLQIEDHRIGLVCHERDCADYLADLADFVFQVYLYLYDLTIKNGAKLSQHLRQFSKRAPIRRARTK